MFPVALVELLEEGLVFFRRALALHSTYGKISGIADLFTRASDDDLRHHKSIKGEEVYFFILGRETVRSVMTQHLAEQKVIDGLVLQSLYSALETRTSADAASCIIEFAHMLGQTFQIRFPDFMDQCNDYLSHGPNDYTLADPVLSFLQLDDTIIPEPTQRVFTDLQVDPSTWSDLVANVKHGKIVGPWIHALSSIPAKGIRPHKTQTFIGLILRGAASVAHDDVPSIPITQGPDGMSLSLGTLTRAEPMMVTRSLPKDTRSITTEMIQATSIRMTMARGFVKTDNEGWIHVSEAEQKEGKDGRTYYQRQQDDKDTVSDSPFATVTAAAKKQALGVLGKIIKSYFKEEAL
jgi:hypothetical protein